MGALAPRPLDAGIIPAATTIDSITATDKIANRRAMTTLEACQLVVDLIRQIAALRGELDAIKAELAVALGERDVYREMVSVTLTQLYEKDIKLKQERDSRFRLLADYRALRGRPCP